MLSSGWRLLVIGLERVNMLLFGWMFPNWVRGSFGFPRLAGRSFRQNEIRFSFWFLEESRFNMWSGGCSGSGGGVLDITVDPLGLKKSPIIPSVCAVVSRASWGLRLPHVLRKGGDVMWWILRTSTHSLHIPLAVSARSKLCFHFSLRRWFMSSSKAWERETLSVLWRLDLA